MCVRGWVGGRAAGRLIGREGGWLGKDVIVAVAV